MVFRRILESDRGDLTDVKLAEARKEPDYSREIYRIHAACSYIQTHLRFFESRCIQLSHSSEILTSGILDCR